MGKYTDCPFCGRRGEKSREHVWGQWLHHLPAAIQLMQGSTGDRIPNAGVRVRLDQDGKYAISSETRGAYARLLPNVTVVVCGDCNNGWMSRLEEQVGKLLEPFFGSGEAIGLNDRDIEIFARWAMTSWMAYGLTQSAVENPFTTAEYRDMALGNDLPARSQIWLLHADAPTTQVSLALESTLLARMDSDGSPPDMTLTPNNTGLGFLAAGGVVLYLVLAPEDAPEEIFDEVLTPTVLRSPGVRRIWPDGLPQSFPLATLPEVGVQSLIAWASQLFSAIALPVDGLSPAEAEQVMYEYRNGADPANLRARFENLND